MTAIIIYVFCARIFVLAVYAVEIKYNNNNNIGRTAKQEKIKHVSRKRLEKKKYIKRLLNENKQTANKKGKIPGYFGDDDGELSAKDTQPY